MGNHNAPGSPHYDGSGDEDDYDDNDDDVDIVRADAHMKKGHLGSPPGSPLS